MSLTQRVALVVVGPRRRLNPEARCTFQPAEHHFGCRCMIWSSDRWARKEISRKRDT